MATRGQHKGDQRDKMTDQGESGVNKREKMKLHDEIRADWSLCKDYNIYLPIPPHEQDVMKGHF